MERWDGRLARHGVEHSIGLVRRPHRVIVVGGGVAGIAAALRLAGAGAAVTLFETRRKLGGRATSFDDVRTGERLDNCQHITLGCCANYMDLLRRLGVADKIAWSQTIWWIERSGRRSAMTPGVLPAPAHFARSFLTARFLTMDEKFAIARAMHVMMRADRSELESITFGDWLSRLDQPAGAVDRFWAPVVVSACNVWPERLAASEAAHVFQDGFLAHRDAAMMGVPTVPLVELYGAAEKAIAGAGGSVRLGVSIARIESNEVETVDGERFSADAVICAVPFERALKIVSDETQRRDERFHRLGKLQHSPILGVHLTFDRPVMDVPHAALVGTGTQWLFRKDAAGKRVHAVISGADAWMTMTEAEIVERVVEDVRACFSMARSAALVSGRPIKEKRATFAPTCDSISLRPSATGSSGLILAGDYTQTGWPSTMEGATISGYRAAAATMGWNMEATLAPAQKPEWLYATLRAMAKPLR